MFKLGLLIRKTCLVTGVKQCLLILEHTISFMPIQCSLSTRTGNLRSRFIFLIKEMRKVEELIIILVNYRCEMEDIVLEMDRILRPEGSVIIRDDVDILVKVKRITDAMKWDSQIVDHEDGPLEREKLLFAVKLYWTAAAPTIS